MKTWMMGAACALAMGWAGSASASTIVVTFSGPVEEGSTDAIGFLGQPGADHGGQTLVETYTFDTTLGQVTDYGNAHILGPTGSSDPLVSLTLAVGGVTTVVDLSQADPQSPPQLQVIGAYGVFTGFNYTPNPLISSITAGINDDFTPNGIGYPFSMSGGPGFRGWVIIDADYARNTYGTALVADFYNVSVTSDAILPPVPPLGPPLPEPSTWAMMAIGVAAMGAGLRRRGRHQHSPAVEAEAV